MGQRHLLDHLPPGHERRHQVEKLAPAPQHADAGRPIGLVTGKRVEVDVEVAKVERTMRRALRAVEHDFRSHCAGRGHHPADIGQRAGHVRAMRERDQPASLGEFAVQPIEIEPPLRRHRQEAQNDALPLGQPLPGHQIAVMFENREQDLVAGLQAPPNECANKLIEEVVP